MGKIFSGERCPSKTFINKQGKTFKQTRRFNTFISCSNRLFFIMLENARNKCATDHSIEPLIKQDSKETIGNYPRLLKSSLVFARCKKEKKSDTFAK